MLVNTNKLLGIDNLNSSVRIQFRGLFLILILVSSFFLNACKEKGAPSDPDRVPTGYCKKGDFSIMIDGERYCTGFGEYKPSLNSRFSDEERDDVLKFWFLFDVEKSKKHKDWERIYFIGTVRNINKIGVYSFDNSDYDFTSDQNGSIRTSFIWIGKKNIPWTDDYWYHTKNQYVVKKGFFKVTRFSKQYISGTYSVTASKKNGETVNFNGYFEDLDVK